MCEGRLEIGVDVECDGFRRANLIVVIMYDLSVVDAELLCCEGSGDVGN